MSYTILMAHHAFVAEGTQEEVVGKARGYAARALGLHEISNPDIRVFTFGLFSVEDARKVTDAAYQSGTGDQKLIIIYAARLFHESQNALLKVFEEPPAGVTIILGIPSLGILLPTLRSRLLSLPEAAEGEEKVASELKPSLVAEFLDKSTSEREKYLSKLIDRSKSDTEQTKQEARIEAAELIKGLMEHSYSKLHEGKKGQNTEEIQAFLEDLASFMPLMYERSVPLKLIFEHIQLVIPTSAIFAKV